MTGLFEHGEPGDGDLVESAPACDIPQDVKDAVVAIENPTFWTDKGIDKANGFELVITDFATGDAADIAIAGNNVEVVNHNRA